MIPSWDFVSTKNLAKLLKINKKFVFVCLLINFKLVGRIYFVDLYQN